MDVETALQGAHDLQEALLGDVEVAQAGEAAGGAIGGAGVVAGPSGVQVVSADIHVPPAPVPEGITYKLPLPPPGVEIHTYVKESIKVVYISVLH